ncbi:M23 family metallopeptidase [Pseudaestuariivita atlantica]|uniref:M23 family metallopeptidase n=1 Tax=Pseudaestuariivita atlantica TaxID=1317121 RepID=UPI00106B2AA4|nr:M23 family metallopeptidase [Pseudaestuariivita atlantica]
MKTLTYLFGAIAGLATIIAVSAASAQSIRVDYPDGAPRIASEFNSKQGVNGGKRRARHQGIDIKGKNRMPILAAADGKVLEVDTGTCWGPTVVIDHGKGYDGKKLVIAYGHVGDVSVKAGQRVKRGQQIAQLGNNHKKYKCIVGVRHLHMQIGRQWRGPKKGSYWGHVRYLKDGKRGVNPHLYWAGGKGKVTCFRKGETYPAGTLTYPVACR